MLIDQSAEHQLLAGTSREVSETICFSKDTSKTVSPTGSWETQTYTHHKDWLLCPIFWLGMWLVAKYHAPGWEVRSYCLEAYTYADNVPTACAYSDVAAHCVFIHGSMTLALPLVAFGLCHEVYL